MTSPLALMDPQMRYYVERSAELGAPHGDPYALASLDETRTVLERLLLPWAEGGPQMAESVDRRIPGPRGPLTVRVHLPTRARALRVLVYIHGGGWMVNTVETHGRLMREYAARIGCAVVAPHYSKSPEHRFPTALDECAALVRWLAAHGTEWGLDPQGMVIGGDSAGGNLALATGLVLRQSGERILGGIINNYGVLDCDLDTPTYARFGAGGYLLTRDKMAMFWDAYMGDQDRRQPLAAPLRADLAGLPPTLTCTGELDVLADENIAFARKALAAGVPSELHVYPGLVHGFMRVPHVVDLADEAHATQARWVRRLWGLQPVAVPPLHGQTSAGPPKHTE